MLRRALEPFNGTAVHYAVAYIDAVFLGAARDMADREVRVQCNILKEHVQVQGRCKKKVL